MIVWHKIQAYSNLRNNLSNLWFEAHVEHPICFIQHQERTTRHGYSSNLQEIQKTTWCGDANVDSTAQIACLASFWSASIQTSVRKTHSCTVFLRDFLDLLGEFSGRQQNQNRRPLPMLSARLVQSVQDTRKQELSRSS